VYSHGIVGCNRRCCTAIGLIFVTAFLSDSGSRAITIFGPAWLLITEPLLRVFGEMRLAGDEILVGERGVRN
jgi:hypothetical protein